MLIMPRAEYCQFVYVVSTSYTRRVKHANGIRNTFQQFTLFVLIMMGSAIFVSSAIIHIRKRAFEKKLEELAARKSRARGGRALTFSLSRRRGSNTSALTDAFVSGAVRGTSIKETNEGAYPETTEHVDQNTDAVSGDRWIAHGPSPIDTALTSTVSMSDSVARRERKGGQANVQSDNAEKSNEHIRFGDDGPPIRDPKSPTRLERVSSDPMRPLKRAHTRLFDGSGVGVRGLDQHPRNARPLQLLSEASTVNENSIDEELSLKRRGRSLAGIDKYLKTIDGSIGRNSQFHNLTEKERRKLGGIEYDAICLLSYVVPIYFLLWQLFGALGVGAWFQINAPDLTLQNG
jgi:hypothetical protein